MTKAIWNGPEPVFNPQQGLIKPGDPIDVTVEQLLSPHVEAGPSDEVPNVDEIEGWVDGQPERAELALAFERARGKKARSTLVSSLEQLLDADGITPDDTSADTAEPDTPTDTADQADEHEES